jgi:hypothetical protein
MLAQITGLSLNGGEQDPGGRGGGCRKCGLDHVGGVNKCPFKMLSNKDTRKQVAQFMAALGNMSGKDATKFLRNEDS